MPISYAGNRAEFTGRCIAEEADALLDWLRGTPDAAVDLGGCDDLHTALAQLLLVARVPLVSPPNDPCLAACFGAACPSLPSGPGMAAS
ncbi:hypothetical protein [Roseicella aquatilis]|uniref:Uncharacterized protein n=1 Tax=Roseicella aquatilis TaxID=2527868 RepID=A0A4R4DT41_9PROT|nr:hypothetical protein [Roseicella aquatilis]TCZ65000.1 hypothetical protein EXY23_06425 [Roseicella aquatilis]